MCGQTGISATFKLNWVMRNLSVGSGLRSSQIELASNPDCLRVPCSLDLIVTCSGDVIVMVICNAMKINKSKTFMFRLGAGRWDEIVCGHKDWPPAK